MARATSSRGVTDEYVGLLVAFCLHALLIAWMAWRPPSAPMITSPERVSVTLVDSVGLSSAAPVPDAEAAAEQALESGAPVQETESQSDPAPEPAVHQDLAAPNPDPGPVPKATPSAAPSVGPAAPVLPEPRSTPRPPPNPVAKRAPVRKAMLEPPPTQPVKVEEAAALVKPAPLQPAKPAIPAKPKPVQLARANEKPAPPKPVPAQPMKPATPEKPERAPSVAPRAVVASGPREVATPSPPQPTRTAQAKAGIDSDFLKGVRSGRSSGPAAPPSTASPGASRLGEDFLEGVPGAQASGAAHSPPAVAIGPAVQSALAGSISRQLKPHWVAPQGAEAEMLVTVLAWSLDRNGNLTGSPRIVRQEGITDANRPQAARHAEQAVRAIQLAAPFDLPPEYYDAWKRVGSFRFDRKLSL